MFYPSPPKDWYIKELIQDKNFDDNQWFTDKFYRTHEVMPYIYFDLFSQNTNSKEKTKEINIIFGKDCGYKKVKFPYKPFELFLSSFWEKMWGNQKGDYALTRRGFIYERLLGNFEARKDLAENNYIREIYDISIFLGYIDNIWDEYCLFEGFASMPRKYFYLWLYRLHCIIYDLLEHPYIKDKDWEQRILIIKSFYRDKYSKEYEYFDKSNWKSIIRDKEIAKDKCFTFRLKDAEQLLNDFFNQVKPNTALEKFLISFYESFGKECINNNWLITCKNCNSYTTYFRTKKFCSKTCSKRFHSKQDYRKYRAKRLPLRRAWMQKTRKEIPHY